MGIQEVRWGKGSTELAEGYTIYVENYMKSINIRGTH
jgi:hypothetical protein